MPLLWKGKSSMSDKFYDIRNTDWSKGIGNYRHGYEPPISLVQKIADEITEMHDNSIYMKVCEIVDVNKEELLKALAYDRDQYEKGYREGFEAGERLAMTTLANSILDEYGRK